MPEHTQLRFVYSICLFFDAVVFSVQNILFNFVKILCDLTVIGAQH